MWISFRWLQRHIDLSGLSPDEVANRLTLSTAEVEGVHAFLPHASQLLVGKVLEKKQHPGADRLSLCQVDVGQGAPLPIVCGAPNVAQGQLVPVAMVGTELPGIGKLKKSKIRGEVSTGMICSEEEVGLSEHSEGIWALPASLSVGQSLSQALELEDWVIDIDNKSLTHRPDLWGHRGIARELSAIFERPLLPLDLSMPATGSEPPIAISEQSGACSRYVALPIAGARSLPSPLWLLKLLLAVGQRSRGQLVDLSNFVMLDLGQPNHTFDRAEVASDGICVRRAQQKEAFSALDGQALELSKDDLVISSGGRAIALAGVIGGENSQVTDATSGLVLEVATFDATTVRRTSTRHGVRTESSARFEKSLDPHLPLQAAAHFARLLQELQPEVQLLAPCSDTGAPDPTPLRVPLRLDRVRSSLGAELSDETIVGLLTRLGFGVEGSGAERSVVVPSFRATKDIGIERDLVEEVGRLYGYDNIAEQPLRAVIEPPPYDERRLMVRKVQDRLALSAGFTETIGYSFQSDELLKMLGLAGLPHATVDNPVASSESRMRRSLVPSLLARIEQNRRARDEVRLFEVGKGYLPETSDEGQEPRERHWVSLLLARPPASKNAHFHDNALSQLQGVVTDLVRALERALPVWAQSKEPPSWAHPAHALRVGVAGSDLVLGDVCELSPEVARRLGLSGQLASDVALAEISLDALLEAPRRPLRFQPVPRFPGIKVDVAVIVDSGVHCAQLEEVIRKAGGSHVHAVELFDLYVGDSVGAGKKSLAFHVTLQSPERTLGEKEEQKFLERLGRGLKEMGAQLRDG